MGHFYTQQGTLVTEDINARQTELQGRTVYKDINATGGEKQDLGPSVTEIIKGLSKPGLDYWKGEQMYEATLQVANEDMDEGERKRKAFEISDEIREKAAFFGREMHLCLHDMMQGRSIRHPEYSQIIEDVKEHVYALEPDHDAWESEGMFCSEYGFGGTIDLSSNKTLEDMIKRNISDLKGRAKLDKLQVYPEERIQLAGYGLAKFGGVEGVTFSNIYVGRETGEIITKVHTPAKMKEALNMFIMLLNFYFHRHYKPTWAKDTVNVIER